MLAAKAALCSIAMLERVVKKTLGSAEDPADCEPAERVELSSSLAAGSAAGVVIWDVAEDWVLQLVEVAVSSTLESEEVCDNVGIARSPELSEVVLAV